MSVEEELNVMKEAFKLVFDNLNVDDHPKTESASYRISRGRSSFACLDNDYQTISKAMKIANIKSKED